jgi:hypothetical protein
MRLACSEGLDILAKNQKVDREVEGVLGPFLQKETEMTSE